MEERIIKEINALLTQLFSKMKESGYEWDADKKQLKKIEQKPAWGEEDENMLKSIIATCELAEQDRDSSPAKHLLEMQTNWLKFLKERVQPKLNQEWSEGDERNLNDAILFIETGTYSLDKDNLINWLKSLKGRVQPQSKQEWKQENAGDLTDFENTMMHIGESFFGKNAGLDPNDTNVIKEQANLLLELVPKQEWSQNDIEMIDWLIRCCEKEHEELCNDKYGHQDIVSDLKRDCRKKWDWLESLKNRVGPQKQWKPTDEQMKALKDACDEHWEPDGLHPLYSLYEQLKQL